jgi:GNAT superfamily N-acetyltransferase
LRLQIRPIEPDDIPQAARLIASVFQESVAPLYNPDGIREFMSYATAEAFSRRLRGDHIGFVALEESSHMVGVIEVRGHRHISLLFVESAFQRKGIGRRLVSRAIEACRGANPGLSTLTVHASPNSVQAYERLGFVRVEPEQERNGIKFVPMALTVSGSWRRATPR